MKKKHYIVRTKYPHQVTSLGPKIKKWHKPAKEVIKFFGESYIDLGELTFIKSLYVAFRIGFDINKCFTVGKEDVQIMVLNQ